MMNLLSNSYYYTITYKNEKEKMNGTLTFNPSPPLKEDEEFQLATTNNQAKLMRWHYRLGHPSFAKLKMLARNGEIPR
jgi:hypothetical protein